MNKLTDFLKNTPEINLSALGRAAGIKSNRLPQAVKEVEYRPGYIRRLTTEEEQRIMIALAGLGEKILNFTPPG